LYLLFTIQELKIVLFSDDRDMLDTKKKESPETQNLKINQKAAVMILYRESYWKCLFIPVKTEIL